MHASNSVNWSGRRQHRCAITSKQHEASSGEGGEGVKLPGGWGIPTHCWGPPLNCPLPANSWISACRHAVMIHLLSYSVPLQLKRDTHFQRPHHPQKLTSVIGAIVTKAVAFRSRAAQCSAALQRTCRGSVNPFGWQLLNSRSTSCHCSACNLCWWSTM